MHRRAKTGALALFTLFFVLLAAQAAEAQDHYYHFTSLMEVNAQGKVLQQAPAQGWILLRAGGTYSLQYSSSSEQGSYRLMAGGQNQGKAMLMFQSSAQRKFFAYPSPNNLLVWVRQTPQGNHLFLNAVAARPPSGGQSKAGPATTPGRAQALPPLAGGVFSRAVMFGDTSAPHYYRRDPNSNELTAGEKGVVFRPNGAFALRSEFGNSVFNGHGAYRVSGDRIQMTFSDGSGMSLVIDQGGKKLNWYNNGMLISEFFFYGVLK